MGNEFPNTLNAVEAHPEAVGPQTFAPDLPPATVAYWVARRNDAEDFFANQSHIANERVLFIPASVGPSIAIASVAVSAVASFTTQARLVIFSSAVIMIISAALSFILFLHKNTVCVDIYNHINKAKIAFAKGEIPHHEIFYNKRHTFSGFMWYVFLSTSILYFISIFGIAAGFGLEVYARQMN